MKHRRLLMFGLMLVWSSLLVMGCATINEFGGGPVARRPNVVPEVQLRDNPGIAEGQRVFMEHCNQCHVGGAAGLGPSLNDRLLPPWFVKFQVRRGLGAMPAYSSSVITETQLDDVTAYMRYIRLHPNGTPRG
jgi:mono/diheme cytochrome c family protein